MKGGLFLAVGLIAAAVGARTVEEYSGLAKRMPFAAGALAVLGIALVGVPPSIGFVGKWFIAVGAVETGAWPVAVVIFLSTMLTLAYVARLLEKMYFTPPVSRPAPGAVAADGGSETPPEGVADGGDPAPTEPRDLGAIAPDAVSRGMLWMTILAALLAVALGFAGDTFDSLLTPFIEEVLNG